MENRMETQTKKKFKKMERSHNLATPLLNINFKKMFGLCLTDVCTPMFIAALFTIIKMCLSVDD
jgi:hypothetical protein